MHQVKMIMLLGTALYLNANIATAAAASGGAYGGSGGASAPTETTTTPSFKVLTQKEFPEGSYGPGHPITYRVLETPSYKTTTMVAGDSRYGVSYTGHAEFSDRFVADALKSDAHTLELGFGVGYHVRRIVEASKETPVSLALVEISLENVTQMDTYVGTTKSSAKIKVQRPCDGRKFLNVAKLKPESYDNIGAFHVMHFWTPTEILAALTNIHTMLKPDGTLTITLSDNPVITSSEYGKHAEKEPWTGSVFSHPLMSESYKLTHGDKTGQIVTHLPAGALAELLTAHGFEVLQAESYCDFYPQNVHTPFADHVEYVGVRAKKVGAPSPDLLAKWIAHAAVCETIRTTDHSDVLSAPESAALAREDAVFKAKHAYEANLRRLALWSTVKKGAK